MPFPAMLPEEFSKAFPGYGRERTKELNRLYPESYAARSWFTAASADKRGDKLDRDLEKLQARNFPDFAERAAKMVGAHELGLQKSIDDEAARNEAFRVARSMARQAPAKTGPATPQGNRMLPPHSVPAPEAAAVYDIKSRRVVAVISVGVHPEGLPHFGSRSGEVRSKRGMGDLHAGSQSTPPRRGADALADAALRIKKLEAQLEAKRSAGGNDRKLARQIRAAKHEYAEQEHAHRTGGVMERLHAFDQHNGKTRTTRGRAVAEKMAQEGGRKDYV